MVAACGLPVVFWFHSFICLAGTVFAFVFLPETQGKTLTELSNLFVKKPETPKMILPTSLTLSKEKEASMVWGAQNFLTKFLKLFYFEFRNFCLFCFFAILCILLQINKHWPTHFIKDVFYSCQTLYYFKYQIAYKKKPTVLKLALNSGVLKQKVFNWLASFWHKK